MKLLGLDYGTKYIGTSVSDDNQSIAFPRTKIANTPACFSAICSIIQDEEIGAIVLGRPLNMKGLPTPMTTQVEEFRDQLSKHVLVPIHWQDERLTSKLVDKAFASLAVSSKDRRGQKDALEASMILQQYLDSQK